VAPVGSAMHDKSTRDKNASSHETRFFVFLVSLVSRAGLAGMQQDDVLGGIGNRHADESRRWVVVVRHGLSLVDITVTYDEAADVSAGDEGTVSLRHCLDLDLLDLTVWLLSVIHEHAHASRSSKVIRSRDVAFCAGQDDVNSERELLAALCSHAVGSIGLQSAAGSDCVADGAAVVYDAAVTSLYSDLLAPTDWMSSIDSGDDFDDTAMLAHSCRTESVGPICELTVAIVIQVSFSSGLIRVG